MKKLSTAVLAAMLSIGMAMSAFASTLLPPPQKADTSYNAPTQPYAQEVVGQDTAALATTDVTSAKGALAMTGSTNFNCTGTMALTGTRHGKALTGHDLGAEAATQADIVTLTIAYRGTEWSSPTDT